jgi:hypothetical protein
MTRYFKFTTVLTAAAFVALGGISVPHTANAQELAQKYYDYDYDADNFWNEDEWLDYSYDRFDLNDDSYIDDQEWDNLSAGWYDPYEITNDNDLSVYDTNDDGWLDENEYAETYDSDLYDAWDTDRSGLIDETEYGNAMNTYNNYSTGAYN